MTQVNTSEISHDDAIFHIDPTTLYSQEFIVWKFRIAKKTLSKWHSLGLKQCRPGTLKAYYLGSHLLKFFDAIPAADDDN